jgi:hypothetical protein
MSAPRTTLHPSGGRKAVGRTVRRRRTSGNAARRRPSAKGSRRASGSANQGNWWSAVLLVVAVVAGVAYFGEDDKPTPAPAAATCTLPASGVDLTPAQVANAAVIADVGWSRGLPDRAVVIALATAHQESRLRNLDYGDRDSLGLFQQRPSMGWGSEAQVQDPEYAAGTFYDRLVQVPGWETGRLTEVAQTIQRSGHPELYQQWQTMALELTMALKGDGLTPDSCA